MSQTINIGLVEDQLLFRQGIKAILESWPDFKVMFEAENGYSVEGLLEKSEVLPDVLLLDLSLPPDGNKVYSGSDVTQMVKERFPDVRIIILSVNNDPFVMAQLVEMGANGYLLKDSHPDEVRNAIMSVWTNGAYINAQTLNAIQGKMGGSIQPRKETMDLSKREVEVLQLICQQLTTEQIAEKLFISGKTVNGHRSNLLLKTGASNVAGLVMYAIKNELVSLY